MLPESRTERCLFLLLSGILVFASGCRSAPPETISVGDWLYEINRRACLPEDTSEAYYANVTEYSVYYTSVQNAAGWGVIDVSHAVHPEEALTREYAAYTLMNLAGINRETGGTAVKDISGSEYRKEIESAVSFGLFDLDHRSCFRPHDTLPRDEALEKLDMVVRYMNKRIPETNVYADLPEYCDELPDEEYLAEGMVVYPAGTTVSPGTILPELSDGQHYTVDSVTRSEDRTTVTVHPSDTGELTGTISISGSTELDFSKAEIIDDSGLSEEISSYTAPVYTHLAALYIGERETRSFEYKGYRITWSLSGSGIHAMVERSFAGGSVFVSEFRLSGVRPVYDWKMKDGKISEGYFRIDFNTNERCGFSHSSKKEYVSDEETDPAIILQSVRNLFRKNGETASLHIPVCTIRVPVCETPPVSVLIRLELTVSAEGKAEIALSQENSIGMEIRSGSMRMIHDMQHTHKQTIYAKAEALADVLFGLDIAKITLADAGLQSGVQASVDPVVHLYRNNTHHVRKVDDTPYDLLDEQTTPYFLVCADLSAGWLMDLCLNSAGTIAGKLGFSGEKTLMTPESNSILPDGLRHMENGLFVRTCTRDDRISRKGDGTLPDTERIAISAYSMIIDPGETKEIPISSLPEGIGRDDIILTSSRQDIVTTDGLRITGVSPGSARIRVASRDGRYSVDCSVLVRSRPE